MHFSTSLLVAGSLLVGSIDARPSLAPRSSARHQSNPVMKRSVRKPIASRAPSELAVSNNVLSMTRKKSATGTNERSAYYAKSLVSNSFSARHKDFTKRDNTTTYQNGSSSGLISLFEGEEFATSITFGNESFYVIVDTGSSDTWVAETNFSCVDIQTSAPESEATCGFGPLYTKDDTFVEIPGVNFNITYGDGEFLTGVFGYDMVTLAGIQVNQTVAVVNYAAWEGDGTTSGLVGFAYPALTSEYNGTDPTADNSASGEQIKYSPIFDTMVSDGLVDSNLFSLVIERDNEGPAGYLALGGVPPIDFVQNFTSTPILVTSIGGGYPDTYDFYTIEIDGLVLDGASIAGTGGATQYIVDSGTTLNYLPTAAADAINAAFVPPARYSRLDGAYIVGCNATAPELAVRIAGVDFHTNALDMILYAGTDNKGADVCISGIDDGGSGPEALFILGDTFQKNVVSVFDLGAAQMRFAAREYYASDDTY